MDEQTAHACRRNCACCGTECASGEGVTSWWSSKCTCIILSSLSQRQGQGVDLYVDVDVDDDREMP